MVARCQAAGGAGGTVCPVCAVCHATAQNQGWQHPLVSSQLAELLFIYLLWFYLMLHVQEGHSTRWHLGICMDAISGCLGGASFTLDPSCAVLKGHSKTCRCVLHPTGSKQTLILACVLVVSCIYLLLLPVSDLRGEKNILRGNQVLVWCRVYISKVRFETWPHDI